ncbi:SDR family oxidoreductase [Microbacterium sp. NPDC056234]|uniref:SDR family oxidoreductase n=1 Tax=Microbacterium sp. NPDC056234 TaxID=3345757 RepID=UPI0035DC5727
MNSDQRVYVVTGADSGLGRATALRLAEEGSVITCGLGDDIDVRADLGSAEGRRAFVERVSTLSGGRLDGVVACAGSGAARETTVSLNFFGAVATLEGLRDLLAASDAPAAVAVSSSSTLNRGSTALVHACMSGDEDKARSAARFLTRTRRGSQIYRSSKIALNQWVREAAVSPRWTHSGIVLNAVAPGIIATDVVLDTWDRDRAVLETALPQPLGAPGPVDSVAELLAGTVSAGNRFMTGQVIYADGGTDALMRGSRPQRVFLRYRSRDVIAMWRASRQP